MIGQPSGWGRVLQRRGGQGIHHRIADLGGVELIRQTGEAEMQFVGPADSIAGIVDEYPHLARLIYRSGYSSITVRMSR